MPRTTKYKLYSAYVGEDVKIRNLLTKGLERAGISSVEIELQGPVHAGQRLDYEVRTAELVDRIVRFDATAEVSGRAVARGVIRMDA